MRLPLAPPWLGRMWAPSAGGGTGPAVGPPSLVPRQPGARRDLPGTVERPVSSFLNPGVRGLGVGPHQDTQGGRGCFSQMSPTLFPRSLLQGLCPVSDMICMSVTKGSPPPGWMGLGSRSCTCSAAHRTDGQTEAQGGAGAGAVHTAWPGRARPSPCSHVSGEQLPLDTQGEASAEPSFPGEAEVGTLSPAVGLPPYPQGGLKTRALHIPHPQPLLWPLNTTPTPSHVPRGVPEDFRGLAGRSFAALT